MSPGCLPSCYSMKSLAVLREDKPLLPMVNDIRFRSLLTT